MDYKKIKTIIDKWDPINLLAYAPEDEYDLECKEIYNLISNNMSIEFIAKTIFSVFSQSIRGMYRNSQKDYKLIYRCLSEWVK